MVRTAKHHRRQVGPRAAPPSRGTSQAGMGRYNARLVLSLIRSHGSLSKAAIARLTGLSAQAISAIIGQLERDGMLLRLAPVRGKVGQPSTPLSLDPEGAFSLGFKFGRRRCDLVGGQTSDGQVTLIFKVFEYAYVESFSLRALIADNDETKMMPIHSSRLSAEKRYLLPRREEGIRMLRDRIREATGE